MSDEIRSLISAFMEALSEGRIEDACGCLADNAVWRIVATSRPAVLNKVQFADTLRRMLGAFVECRFSIFPLAIIVEGGRAAVEAESFGKTKCGHVYNNRYHFLFVVDGYKVIEVREY